MVALLLLGLSLHKQQEEVGQTGRLDSYQPR
jgi:hypothetical protein